MIDTDRPGTCYFLNGAKLEAMPIRILYLDDATVKAVAAARAGVNARIDERSEAAITRLFPAFADRPRYVADGSDDGLDDETGTGTDSGTGDGTGGTASETGTETGTETEEEPMGEIPEWNDGPDVDLADVIAARRERMTDAERERLDRDREAALAAEHPADDPPEGRLDEEEAKQAVLRKLADAWPEDVAAKDLQQAATRGSSWFYPWANGLAEARVIERTKHGRWKLVAPPPKVADPEPAHSV
jgi:hypothetical protein